MNRRIVTAAWLTALAIGTLTACHDTRRHNPLDPELTPPVSALSARLDPGLGAVALQWRAYEGAQPFGQYCVMRQESELVRVETLTCIADRAQTTYLDTSVQPDTDYDYFVEAVNAAGFAHPEAARQSVSALQVRGVELFEPVADSLQGRILLRWPQYRGPGFQTYEVLRARFGGDGQVVANLPEVADTTFADTSALPDQDYLYAVSSRLFDRAFPSQQRPARYGLPSVDLQRVSLSSETACAELAWSPYTGPRFDAYALLRQVPGSLIDTFQVVDHADSTVFLDCGLEGNTAYSYAVFVRTRFQAEAATALAGGVGVQSGWLGGRFYALSGTTQLTSGTTNAVQALAMGFDPQDQLVVAATYVTTTSADNMQPGIHLSRPAVRESYGRVFSQVLPERLSPVRLVAVAGRAYVAVTDTSGVIVVGAVDLDGPSPRAAWLDTLQAAAGRFPAGLSVHGDGAVVLTDDSGYLYAYDADGRVGEADDAFHLKVREQVPVTFAQFVVGVGAGTGNDEMFYLTPGSSKNKVVGATRVSLNGIFGGTSQAFDDGVGIDPGQTLAPLALAYDGSRNRLAVLESRGVVQVSDVETGIRAVIGSSPYITRWGSLGVGEGQFLFNPTTAAAVAVDSQGRIHVGDAAVPGGRIQVFEP